MKLVLFQLIPWWLGFIAFYAYLIFGDKYRDKHIPILTSLLVILTALTIGLFFTLGYQSFSVH